MRHFRYGSIGAERRSGIPHALWRELPDLFPEAFAPALARGDGAYAAFGFVYERDARGKPFDLPIGILRRKVQGVELVWFNCAVCHAGTWRAEEGAPRRIVDGMPSNNRDLQGFVAFLLGNAADERMRPMNQTLRLGWTEAQPQARLCAYRRLLRINLLLQAGFGALCVLFPAWTIAWLGLSAEPTAWVRAWGAMMLLVSLLCVPAWYAPVRARFIGPVGLLGCFLTGTLYLVIGLSGPALRGFIRMALFDLGFAIALSFSCFALFRAEPMSRP